MTKYRFLIEVEFNRELEADEMQQMRVALRNFVAGDAIAELPPSQSSAPWRKGPCGYRVGQLADHALKIVARGEKTDMGGSTKSTARPGR
jgi:hypothetical protein